MGHKSVERNEYGTDAETLRCKASYRCELLKKTLSFVVRKSNFSSNAEKHSTLFSIISNFPVFLCGHFIILGTRLGQRGHNMF